MQSNYEQTNKNFMILLIVLIVIYKFFTFRMFDIGGDAINYWFAAKHLYFNIPYVSLNHQTTRFGLIIPIWLSQIIFGVHPIVSVILPNIFLIIHCIIIYKIGTHIRNQTVGFFSVILFILCPYIIRFGSQVAPEAIGGPLVTISFYFLLKYKEKNKYESLYLIIAALLLFWAYCAHELNILFLPGFIIVIYLFKRNLLHLMLFCVCLGILFLIETAIFYVYTGDILARYHAISSNHLVTEKLVPVTFWQLFERYTKSQLWWRIPFYIYLLLIIPLWKRYDSTIKAIIIAGLSYFIIILFAVKSINPIIPALIFKEIYLVFAVPFMVLIFAIAIDDAITFILSKIQYRYTPWPFIKDPLKMCTTLVIVISIIATIITSLNVLPEKASPYYNSICNLTDHKFIRFFTYYTIFNNAYANGIPILSDYEYTIHDKQLYDKIQKLISEGKSLTEALQLSNIDYKHYISIRPSMPTKSLNAVRKVFLNVHPHKIPKIHTVQFNNKITYFIVNEEKIKKNFTSLFYKGAPVVYATKVELKAIEGKFHL